MSRYGKTVDYFMAITLKYDGWVLIGAQAAIGMNTVCRFYKELFPTDETVPQINWSGGGGNI